MNNITLRTKKNKVKVNNVLPSYYKGDEIKPPNISDYTICTITAMSKFNKLLDLNVIYENLINSKKYDNIKAVKYKNTTVGKFKRKLAYNQITIIVNNNKKDNVKIFKNGQINITGCKEIRSNNTLPEAEEAVNYINNIINKIPNSYEDYDNNLNFEVLHP